MDIKQKEIKLPHYEKSHTIMSFRIGFVTYWIKIIGLQQNINIKLRMKSYFWTVYQRV